MRFLRREYKMILVYCDGIYKCELVSRRKIRGYKNIKVAIDQRHGSIKELKKWTEALNEQMLRRAA